MEDDPFGGLFNEDGDTGTTVPHSVKLGTLPELPSTERASSGFVGLMNQFRSFR